MKFEKWLEENAEGGIHLKGLTPKEYGQAIWAGMQERIDQLEKENSDLRGMIHRMKLNSKGLCHLVDNLKDSCVINMNDAKEFCDKMCSNIEAKEKENEV